VRTYFAVCLAVLLLSGPGASAQGWVDAPVLIRVTTGNVQAVSSGVILGGNGGSAVVLTCAHGIESPGPIAVYRQDGHGYRARCIAVAEGADLAALLIKDTGDLPRVALAGREGVPSQLAGFGTTARLRRVPGQFLGSIGRDVLYSFPSENGDSGAGVFNAQGELLAINWGRGDTGAIAVGLRSLRQFVAAPQVARYLAAPATAPATAAVSREEFERLAGRLSALEREIARHDGR
jgi:S1-C subfamily serine protease